MIAQHLVMDARSMGIFLRVKGLFKLYHPTPTMTAPCRIPCAPEPGQPIFWDKLCPELVFSVETAVMNRIRGITLE